MPKTHQTGELGNCACVWGDGLSSTVVEPKIEHWLLIQCLGTRISCTFHAQGPGNVVQPHRFCELDTRSSGRIRL